MRLRIWMMIAALLSAASLSGCAAAIGAGAAIGADKVAENERGGDGLF